MKPTDEARSPEACPAWISKVAQTNLQLYNQLMDAGWPHPELERLGATYRIAARATAERWRPTEKPFLAHLIGTASIAAHLGLRPEAVTAALVHGISDRQLRRALDQRDLAAALGPETYAIICRYRALQWNPRSAAALAERIATIDEQEREVALLRLANELEDLIDRARLFSAKQVDDTNNGVALAATITLAARIGRPDLASAITTAAAVDAPVPPALVSNARISSGNARQYRRHWPANVSRCAVWLRRTVRGHPRLPRNPPRKDLDVGAGEGT